MIFNPYSNEILPKLQIRLLLLSIDKFPEIPLQCSHSDPLQVITASVEPHEPLLSEIVKHHERFVRRMAIPWFWLTLDLWKGSHDWILDTTLPVCQSISGSSQINRGLHSVYKQHQYRCYLLLPGGGGKGGRGDL